VLLFSFEWQSKGISVSNNGGLWLDNLIDAGGALVSAIIGFLLSEFSSLGKLRREAARERKAQAYAIFLDAYVIINNIKPLASAYLDQFTDLQPPESTPLFLMIKPVPFDCSNAPRFETKNFLLLIESKNADFVNSLFELERCRDSLFELATLYPPERERVLELLNSKADRVSDKTQSAEDVVSFEVSSEVVENLAPEIIKLSSLTAHLRQIAQDADDLATKLSEQIGPLLRNILPTGDLQLKMNLEKDQLSEAWYRRAPKP
jgi:hypothetical protein